MKRVRSGNVTLGGLTVGRRTCGQRSLERTFACALSSTTAKERDISARRDGAHQFCPGSRSRGAHLSAQTRKHAASTPNNARGSSASAPPGRKDQPPSPPAQMIGQRAQNPRTSGLGSWLPSPRELGRAGIHGDCRSRAQATLGKGPLHDIDAFREPNCRTFSRAHATERVRIGSRPRVHAACTTGRAPGAGTESKHAAEAHAAAERCTSDTSTRRGSAKKTPMRERPPASGAQCLAVRHCGTDHTEQSSSDVTDAVSAGPKDT